jgi:hypothetical protein
VDPSALLSMATCLTSLRLEKVSLVPQQMQQDGTSGAARLLQLLARLTALQTLQLDSVASDWPQQLSLFSALTASSDLQRLYIQDCGIEGEAWAHVLPAGRTLPNLRSLAVLRSRKASAQQQQGHAVCSAAIHRLDSCCPGLESLNLLLPPDVWLGSLQRLKSLTQLYLDNVEPGALHELKTLTQLRDLELHAAPAAARGADLVPLVALTRLTELRSCGAVRYRYYRDTDGVPCYEWDEPDDVYLQCFRRVSVAVDWDLWAGSQAGVHAAQLQAVLFGSLLLARFSVVLRSMRASVRELRSHCGADPFCRTCLLAQQTLLCRIDLLMYGCGYWTTAQQTRQHIRQSSGPCWGSCRGSSGRWQQPGPRLQRQLHGLQALRQKQQSSVAVCRCWKGGRSSSWRRCGQRLLHRRQSCVAACWRQSSVCRQWKSSCRSFWQRCGRKHRLD